MGGPDVDQPGRCNPPRQWSNSKAGKRGRDHCHDTAADKALAPGDAGLVERAHGDGADAAGRGECCKRQCFALWQREASRREPAELVLGQRLAAAAAASWRTITASSSPEL